MLARGREALAVEYRSFLDRVRWVAALIVASGHALAILNSQSAGSHLVTIVADMREGAVAVFFILSGYLVGGTVLRGASAFDWRSYGAARFARIYIVLVPALALTVCVDGLVHAIDPANPFFAQPWHNSPFGNTALFGRYGFAEVLGTVLCLQPLTGTSMGSAASLWSLGFEWMFYFVFPAIYVPSRQRWGAGAAVLVVLLSIPIAYQLPRLVGPLWCLWLAGVGAYALERRLTLKKPTAVVARSLAAALIVAYLLDGAGRPYALLLPIVGIAGMMFLAAGRQGEARLSGPFDVWLAQFSFSLYATHMPLMAGMAAALMRFGILPPNGIADPWRVVILALGMTALSLPVAWAFGQVFESRTAMLTGFLKRTLPVRAELVRQRRGDAQG